MGAASSSPRRQNARSQFRCIECGAVYPLDEVRYRCDCGDLLDVITDIASFGAALRAAWTKPEASSRKPPAAATAAAWKAHWAHQRHEVAFLRYKDLLLPDLPDAAVVSLREGDTPLYPASERVRAYCGVHELWLKHEGMNPTLSFKDRGMVAGVSWAKHLGARRVICASTGDTSAAMAAYAARAGIPSAVLLPHGKVSAEQLTQAITYGARVVEIETDFDGCMRLVQELAQDPRVYLLNSMNSIRIEGQKAIGIEALDQLGWRVPDYFAVPVGNAGNLSALGKGLRELREIGVIDRLPRLVGAQAERANPLYTSFLGGFAPLEPVTAGETVASAMRIGNPVSFKKAVRELKASNGLVEQVSEEEIMDARAVVDQSGIAICPNSATAVAAVRKLRIRGVIEEGASVVVMLTGHGAKFSESARRYHESSTSSFANRPVVVEADLGAVRKALGL